MSDKSHCWCSPGMPGAARRISPSAFTNSVRGPHSKPIAASLGRAHGASIRTRQWCIMFRGRPLSVPSRPRTKIASTTCSDSNAWLSMISVRTQTRSRSERTGSARFCPGANSCLRFSPRIFRARNGRNNSTPGYQIDYSEIPLW